MANKISAHAGKFVHATFVEHDRSNSLRPCQCLRRRRPRQASYETAARMRQARSQGGTEAPFLLRF